jgi:hypothetical protein
MNTQFAPSSSKGIEIPNSQKPFLRPIPRAESPAAKSIHEGFIASAWPNRIRAVGAAIANFAIWIAKASIIRTVGPGARALERHEFESVPARRGGFGNVF